MLATIVVAGCGDGGDDTPAPREPAPPPQAGTDGKRVSVGGDEALIWGRGRYGVVLAHGAAFDAASWRPQASRIAQQGMMALAVEDLDPDGILAAARYLKQKRGVRDVALVGGSAGADAILQAAAQEPDAPD